ncbi:MAG: HEAT repeat domain-containing protein [Candidatus Gracilibacteria bacterium]
MIAGFLHRITNVGHKEWPRVILAWSLQLILRTGFVIGWTVTLAMFINRIGIEAMPYLLVLNAVLVIVGSMIYSNLLKVIKRPILIIYTTLLSGSLLLLSTLFVYQNPIAFFGVILIAQSVFLSQLNILISLFIEDLFSPLESERTFPVIASSENLGGVIGGLILTTGLEFLPSYKFIYVWMLILTLVIPTILTSQVYKQKIPSLKSPEEHDSLKGSPFMTMFKGAKKIRKIPFLQGIALLVMLQFMMANFMEFQYTKAIQSTIEEQANQITFDSQSYAPGTDLDVSLVNLQAVDLNAKEAYLEHELTKDLGVLQIIISSGSFLVQILLASRIISGLGIIGSMILSPLVTLLHLFGMVWNFNFFTAATGRSSFEITGGIFRNAYHSSYYALPEKIRSQIKEFMEGFIKPLGAILVFGLFFLIQSIFHLKGTEEIMAINGLMIGLALFMLFRLLFLKKNYTQLCHHNLEGERDLATRIGAIEILSQKGHEIKEKALIKHLKRIGEHERIKIKILETLARRQNPEVVTDILDCLKHETEDVTLSALGTLHQLKTLKSYLKKHVFTRYRTLETVKHLFHNNPSKKIRASCITFLAKIDHGDLIPFILNEMNKDDEQIQSACIKACREFNDSNIIPYIKPYLNHPNDYVRAEAIRTLWQFEFLHPTLLHYLHQMKQKEQKNTILASLMILGDIGGRNDLPYLIQNLASQDRDIQRKAAKALAKHNHPACIPHLVELILHGDTFISKKIKKFVQTLSPTLAGRIGKLLHLRASEYIHDLLIHLDAHIIAELDHNTLEKLKKAYEAIEEHEEIEKIETILKHQQKATRSPAFITQNPYAVSA